MASLCESSDPYGPQGVFLHLFLQLAKNITDGKNNLYTKRIFPSCTILDKEEECNAPLHPSIHPLKVFVQDPFPLGELICGANRQGDSVPKSCHRLNTCGLF